MKTEICTCQDLVACALIYVAMVDHSISENEKDFIIGRVRRNEFKKMLKVYKHDSDLESIERVKLLKDEFFPEKRGELNC